MATAVGEFNELDEQVARLWMANYKAKVTTLQQNLGMLLAQKKALNSRVVTQEYDNFKAVSDKVLKGENTPTDVRMTLIGLEKALKKEGLFKNVKSGFTHMKKEFFQTSGGRNSRPPDPSAEKSQRKTTAVITAPRIPLEKKKLQVNSTGVEDVKTLNKAVGKLFDHLRIQKLSEIARESTNLSLGRAPTTLTKKVIEPPSDNSDDFQDIISKVRNLEQELQRQKQSQRSELSRLAEENKHLKSAMLDMRRENDRLKGLQPITRTAKDKQVEQIAESYNKQKKGIEGKIKEMESELQISLEQTLKEKANLEQMIMEGVSKLRFSIMKLHQRIVGERAMAEKTKTALTLDGVRDEKKSIEDLIRKVAQIELEAQLLEEKNENLGRILTEKDGEIVELRDALLQITEEVSKLHVSITSNSAPEKTGKSDHKVKELLAERTQRVGKNEMKATVEKIQNVDSAIKQYRRILQEKERNASSPKGNSDLIPLKSQINKIHDDLMQVLDPASVNERLSSDKSDSPRQVSPQSQRDRADEINHLLKKLSRVEKACTEIKDKYEKPNK